MGAFLVAVRPLAAYEKEMKFALITPSQQVAELTARYVTVPGEAGEFGVLPGHVPLLATLKESGEVKVEAEDGTTHRYHVTAGFADVRGDGVTVLAEALAPTTL